MLPDTLDAPADRLAQLARRLDAGTQTAADMARLARGFRLYVRARGAIRLERCLDLPTTESKRRARVRDDELRKAAELLRPLTGMARARKLQVDWSRLLCHADFARWSVDGPPADAPPLRQALHWASTYNDQRTLTPKMIKNIVGD